jgi:hypothetical protein
MGDSCQIGGGYRKAVSVLTGLRPEFSHVRGIQTLVGAASDAAELGFGAVLPGHHVDADFHVWTRGFLNPPVCVSGVLMGVLRAVLAVFGGFQIPLL